MKNPHPKNSPHYYIFEYLKNGMDWDTMHNYLANDVGAHELATFIADLAAYGHMTTVMLNEVAKETDLLPDDDN